MTMPPAPAGFEVVEDRSLSMTRASLYALVLTAPLVVPLVLLFGAVWSFEALGQGLLAFFRLEVFLPSVVLGVVAHEVIHGLAWVAAGRLPWREVRFGFQVKTLTPYAHARVPLTARAYRIGAMMPGLLLGLGPALLGVATAGGAPACFGLFMTVAAGGDLAILWLLRGLPSTALVQDHPERAGCLVVKASSVIGTGHR
jgi:hypothetical protein